MWHDVTIKAVLNGYVVQVGCQTLVYDSRKKLILDLAEYLDDPEKKGYEMQETGINRQWTTATPGTLTSRNRDTMSPMSEATCEIPLPPPGRGGGFAVGSIDARV